MSDLSDFDALVVDMMNDFGGPAIVTIVGDSIKDTVTGDLITQKTEYHVRAIILDLPTIYRGKGQVAQTLIQAGEKIIYIQPPEKNGGDPIPEVNPARDSVTMGGTTYNIVFNQDVNPSYENSVLLQFHLKR